ncbi:MAG: hypothetical protein C0469_09020 [Cyanobacteria bacterium DS2.3.42]|nr:hypothetical protein [Cyanobacteria bacterium DS2.3.42]
MSKRFYSKKSEKLASEALKAHQAGKEAMDVHEIRRLEEKLRTDHTDVITRCSLLGFYSISTAEQAPTAWCTHAEWVIKNLPDEQLAWLVLKVPDRVSEGQYEALKAFFLEKVKRNQKNANVAGHAAEFCRLQDLQLKKKLCKKARRLAPDNYKWSSLLCTLYSYEARLNNDSTIAEKAYKVGNKFARRFEQLPHHRAQVYYVLTHLCELALKFNDLERTEKYIKELKNADFDFISPKTKHYYRGLLAIKEGNVEGAKSQLLKFAKKGGRLRDFRLANQLLELGEIQTVLDYLQICCTEEFDADKSKLALRWIRKLQKGQKVSLGFPREYSSPLWDFETK